MSKAPRDRRPQTRKLVHERSLNYVAAYADGMTVNSPADEVGAIVQLNFTRLEASVISEQFPFEEVGGGYRQTGPSVFEQTESKVVECAVLMRPDQAAAAAAAILTALAGLPDSVKRIYRVELTNEAQL